MGEKDITQKLLEEYNDVFADIVNVLLFNGKQIIHEDELSPTGSISQYKVGKTIHEQERDVPKFWKGCEFNISHRPRKPVRAHTCAKPSLMAEN